MNNDSTEPSPEEEFRREIENLTDEEIDRFVDADAEEGKYIDGIYNYCDRWCERCAFTARCRNFHMQAEMGADTVIDDAGNDAFWRTIAKSFAIAGRLIERICKEQGIDINSPQFQAAAQEHGKMVEERRKRKKGNPLLKRAHNYAMDVEQWFKKQRELGRKLENDPALARDLAIARSAQSGEFEDLPLKDAIEIIRWYQFFIAVKMTRSLMREGEADDDDEMMLEIHDRDSDGSAKVALTAIDRSIAAWNILRDATADASDEIIRFMMELSAIRRSLEQAVPKARAFRRPGFDDAQA